MQPSAKFYPTSVSERVRKRPASAKTTPSAVRSPSGVSSLSTSNHSRLNSMRRFSFMAILLVSAMTASARPTFGPQSGLLSESGLRMHQAQCSISSV